MGRAAVLMFLLALLLASSATAQISPGPLSQAHRELGGPSGCTRCHAMSAGTPSFRCLDCHQEISTRLQQKKGLHPAYVPANTGNASCVRCHSEHNGDNFNIVHWDPRPGRFDHSKTGFVLEGKHAVAACARCHSAQKIPASARAEIKVRNLDRTFLGLSGGCTACHEDKHRGQLGNNCTQCHNASDWKIGRTFDHSKTKFALTGAHVQTTCEKCHAPAEGVARFVGLKFQQCASCHADPHRGTFQQGCDSCHSTASWKQTPFMARFDHSKTKFSLLGKHADLRCDTCHRAGDFKKAIAFQVCADCHKPDPHNGQFAKRADGGRCESCHTVDGFKTARFTVVDHKATGFPLREKHATVPCAKCHTPAGKATMFKVKFAACLDCHRDVHGGQFARAPFTNRCERCHNESTFKPATFTLARHQQSAFVLTGGHIAVACNECHKTAETDRAAPYHFATLSCTTCHSDPHKNQFAARMQAVVQGQSGCEACHTTKTWRDVSRFDHSSTRFQLVGTHRAVQCAGCHRPPNLERTLMHVNFGAAPSQCQDCHEDVHGAQFARGGLTHCADCHNSMKWRPSLFDHDMTIFSLRGAHVDVRCSGCHTGFRTVSDQRVLFYKPTPTACAACHGSKTLAGGG